MKLFYALCITFLLLGCSAVESPISSTAQKPSSKTEAAEFDELMTLDKIKKNERTAEVLTYLLGEDEVKDPFTALVVDNFSACNIILRIVEVNGGTIYNLPILKGGKNYLKIKKGNYTLKANLCSAKYYSQKEIRETLILKLTEHH